MTLYPALITDALKKVRYPGSQDNIVDLGMVDDDIRIDGNKVSFSLIFKKSTDPFIKSVVKAAEQAVLAFVGKDVEITGNISVKTPEPPAEKKKTPLAAVKNIIAVASGKGGVGKSTVAVNLAVGLSKLGYKVGLLDADIYGPSVPKMLGIENEPLYMKDGDNGEPVLIPAEPFGIKTLSIGLVIDPGKAAVWRGAMASNALRQLIEQADWGDLDYFIIDTPPGTSDIHLTLVQTVPVTGAVIVTTPQQVALADTRKGIAMFREPKINVPVLGIVDNMAWFVPEPHPDERYYIFGNDRNVDRVAEEFSVPVLARIPLVAAVGDHNDAGAPAVLDDAAPAAGAFMHLAREVAHAVETRNNSLPPTAKVDITRR